MSPRSSAPPPGPPAPAVHRVADVQLRGPGGPLAARAYWPVPGGTTIAAPALLVLLAGNGSGTDGLDRLDTLCRGACAHVGVVVLAVTHRPVAPGDPDAAIDDWAAAVRWAADHARQLGADPGRLLVAGTGAGGSLADAVARRARDDGWPEFMGQVSVRNGSTERMLHDLARSLRSVFEAR
jgi:acetyl esterase/lipase